MPVVVDTKVRRRQGGQCRKCGYDLTGLPFESACPECGTSISASRRRRLTSENLGLAPNTYLWMLSLGSLGLLVGAVGMILTGTITQGSFRNRWIFLGLAASTIWAVSVWPVTAPRVESDGDVARARENGRIARWIARLTQPAWGLAAGCMLLASQLSFKAIVIGTAPGNDALWLQRGGWGLAAIALIGLGALASELAAIVVWAGDEHLGERLKAATIGVVVLPPILIASLAGGSGAIVLTGLAVISGLLLLLAVGHLVFGLSQVSLMAVWAINNAANAEARDERVAQRRKEEMERDLARVQKIHGSPIATDKPRKGVKPKDDPPPIPLADE